ncbi:UbiA family prenyltransferase [Vibrio sp. HN007]|uniref:UbiA family prenyltransferase n=1 Tax=Vibrio iocasae TaxID=3098914 RepID=UPI0035D3F8D3
MESDNNISTLYVDLDGTYIKTDLLFESFISAVKSNPLVIFYCFIWLRQGKAHLKYKLAQYCDINIELMPVSDEFNRFLVQEKEKGRKIVLATASTEKFARQVVVNSEIFDDYIGSSESNNIKGAAKLSRIKEQNKEFAYAGNDFVDFELFKDANEAFLVNPSQKVLEASKQYDIKKVFDTQSSNQLACWIKQLRVHQWLKNLLIFVPLMVSGMLFQPGSIFLSLLAFSSFSSLASATYIFNDLLDLESDRSHPRKKERPLAAGNISILDGLRASILLIVCSLVIAMSTSSEFTVVLIAYLGLTLAYSFKIKQYIGMDVVMLAMLYTVRIIAGAAVLGIQASFWLLAFSIFIFLSLALVKRCSEIHSMQKTGKERASGRDYTVGDYSVLVSFGASSAMLAVLMFCFYINNSALSDQYQQPDSLWLIIPGLCYWLMRMWIKTHRGEMDDDPIVFSLKDRGSLITIGFCCLITLMAQVI